MRDLRPEVEDREILDLLARHFDSPVEHLERVKGGQIARTFAFDVGSERFILRINRRLGANVEKEAFVTRLLAGSGIPIPTIVHHGRMGAGLFFSISREIAGTPLSALDRPGIEALTPALIEMLDAIHAIDVRHTSGYGPAGDDGNGLFPTWRRSLMAVRDEEPEWDFYGKWHVMFETTILERDVFDRCFEQMERLLSFCPEDRSFIHGNVGFGNVLAQGGRITAVLDWQEAGYGDFLYDIAHLDFWDVDAGWVDLIRDHYDQRGLAVPAFHERVHCYQLHTGLNALRFFAKREDEEAYRWTRYRLGFL